MYWIYIIIFTFIIFVPSLVQKGFYVFSVLQTQEYAILLLGILAYTLFVLKDAKLTSVKREKSLMQKDANKMTRELATSYSYIGEINRKLDIFKKLVMQYPAEAIPYLKQDKEMCNSIIDAVHMLTKSTDISIRFIDSKGRMLKEVRKNNTSTLSVPHGAYCEKKQAICETDDYLMVCSPFNAEGIGSCIIISKHGGGASKIEDYEIFKALASHALFLYMFGLKQK